MKERRRRRGRWAALGRKLRVYWWWGIERVANRYFFMEVAPWVLPVGGSIVISNNIGANLNWFWFGIGSLSVLIGTVPLGIRAYFQKHVQREQIVRDARERASLRIVTSLVPTLSISAHNSHTASVEALDEAIKDAVEALIAGVYPKKYGYRATFYMLGKDENQQTRIEPIVTRGRNDKPGTHTAGSSTFDGLLGLLTGPYESASDSNIQGRAYTSYAAASVSRGDAMYGILAVDTDSDWELSSVDEENLVPIADVLAGFFKGTEVRNRSKYDSICSKSMYAIRNKFCKKGVGRL